MEIKDKWFPYIKPTRRKHESGYRVFEVGYINYDEKTKVVIGSCSDHIWNPNRLRLNIDLLDNGCIRFHAGGLQENGITWKGTYAVSSMELVEGWPDPEVMQKLLTNPND